ncbi:hypothetical protein LCGC14_1640030 [marine sediment metagenome]|uniref:Uncharacterized protein n=1 Tax=marine sediment metagenome TaxID=412755 RepID=A0A0F9KZJ1_9ZZZZ
MAEKTYSETDWAVRRWDRFNDKLEKPLSFCQFWRTVLLYATIQQLLAPWRMVERAAGRFKYLAPLGAGLAVALILGGGGIGMGANLVGSVVAGIVLGTALGFLMVFEVSEETTRRMGEIHLGFWRKIGHVLWLLAWPLRTFFPPFGRLWVSGLVAMGEPIERYAQRHKAGLETISSWALLVVCVAIVGFVIIAFLLESWIVTLAVVGALAVLFLAALIGIPQAFWRFFVAVMGLLWGAAVAAKHGICPPVTILRRDS